MLVIMLVMIIIQGSVYAEQENVNVGIYPNEPLVGINQNGEAEGFFVALMNDIAKKEDWNIVYELDYLDQSFEKVDNGETNLMLAVAYTEKRAEKYYYNDEVIYTNWGQVYTNRHQKISSFTSLEGKTIGVEKGDIHYNGVHGIKNTLESFNIHAYYVEYDGREKLMEDLADNVVEAAVVSRLYGEGYEGHQEIHTTPLQFNPIKIKIITCDAENKWMLDKIDEHIAYLKADETSLFYKELDVLVGMDGKEMIPEEVRYVFVLLLTALLAAVIAIIAYKKMIRQRDADIKNQNERLREIIADITALNGISRMETLFAVLVQQLKELMETEKLTLVSLLKEGNRYYLDADAYIEGPLKEFAGRSVEDSPLAEIFYELLAKVDEGSLEIYFEQQRILVPYDSSRESRGYLYIECDSCVNEQELFKLYMANILMNLKVIVYNILKNKEQTKLFIALGELIEKRDNSVANHVKRVSEGCRIMAKACDYKNEAIDNLIIASSVHDIGKIYVPDEILNYPGKLSPEQFEVIKTHATNDFSIFDNVNDQLSSMVHDVVRHHHENWDGTGYPEGLKGEKIPHVARIVSVIDVFEALTHARPYKKAWTYEEACTFIKDNSGMKFDPTLVDTFMVHSTEIQTVFQQFPDKNQ